MTAPLDIERLLSKRVQDIENSGIRRAWALAQACEDPVNLSIGQPDFLVHDSIKQALLHVAAFVR